jgi:protein subunit release factor B
VTEAIHALVHQEMEMKQEEMKTEQQDVMEVGMSSGAAQPKLDPKHLTGTSEESRRSNKYHKLELTRARATPDSLRVYPPNA